MSVDSDFASAVGGFSLRKIVVRPTVGLAELRHWNALMSAHHYLSSHGCFVRGLRQLATPCDAWIALVGWQAAALTLTARDRWTGWKHIAVIPNGRI